ncbi:protein kinase domain-containing protein [Candidatus Electrothrix sp.]|uniref:protein kinase domain-containing protein n=1 Tax=Candidatus Electrothrix sp. TaxID=2170559 RepID=UPI004056ECB7
MLILPHYHVLQKICESGRSLIYRGIRKQDNQPVILKMLKEEHVSPTEFSYRKQEYDIIAGLSHPRVIRAYGIEPYQHTLLLIVEDIAGVSLKRVMENQRVSIQEFFPLALQLADGMAYIHSVDIIHKDISPDNIIVNQETNQLKIIDFGAASRLLYEMPSVQMLERLQGTLAYVSPEQTGRINRRVDYRTDLYSMGIIFYELLAGRLPFQALDALEVVHAHIAKKPSPLYEVAPHVPRVVSDIIMRLLKKNADERYQSAIGVKADLEKCYNNFQRLKDDPAFSFPLAEQDISARLHISQQLYGRQEETRVLLQSFERVCQGQTELMLVSGYSGVGKTALVNEVQKNMTLMNGHFVAGTFEQLQRNTPYSGIAGACDSFCHHLLMEKEHVLAQWREKILAALGDHAQLLVEIIPTLELIIGPQSEVPVLDPTEARNRFSLFFVQFITSLCDKEHPIILFLDDLQWADQDSLVLLRKIITDDNINHLFIIGCYRNNEIDNQHPLMEFLEGLKEIHAVVNTVELKGLCPKSIEQLVQKSLGNQRERIAPLANLIYQKTQGNAFFIHQFLQVLREKRLLHFNLEQQQWQWDIEQIASRNITDNAVDLLAGTIDRLSSASSTLIQLAACIGNTFDFATLVKIYDDSETEALAILWKICRQGLIQPLDENYKHIDLAETAKFKFSHDRIHQAAYGLLADDRKKRIHLQVGRLLIKESRSTTSSDFSENIFDICWHFNQNFDIIDDPEEKIAIARLNLQAGQKAKRAMASQVAIEYLEFAKAYLPANHWHTEYDISLTLYTDILEAYFLLGQFEQVEKHAETMLQKTKHLVDKVKPFEIIIQLYMLRNQMKFALETALQVLEMLEVHLEQVPLEKISVEEIYTLGRMAVPEQQAAMRILNFAISPSYTVAPELYPSLVYTMVRISITHGNSDLSAFGYVNLALLFCASGKIEQGWQVGQAGLWLLNNSSSEAVRAKVFAAYYVTVHHWKKHAQETIDPLLQGSRYGLESGDLEFAGINLMHCGSYLFWLGHPLASVACQHEEFCALMQRCKLEYQQIYLNIWQQTVYNLQGKNILPYKLQGKAFDEETMLAPLLESNYGMAVFAVYLAKTMLCYLFKKINQARDNALLAKKYEQANTGVMVVPIYQFYSSLVLLATFHQVPDNEQDDIIRKVEGAQQQMKFWASHAPENFQHRYALVEAEKARFLKEPGAEEWYEQAILLAEQNNYRIEEALAYELAGEYYWERGVKKIARTFFQEAHSSYSKWGARAKVAELEGRHPELAESCDGIGTTVNATMLHSSMQLDLTSVIKASQTLSQEIVLSKLLANMMRIVMENAGAEKGLLLLPRQKKWFIETEGTADNDEIKVLCSIALEEYSQVPSTLIHYIARTRENVVLSDAAQEERFRHDPYILQEQCTSILGMPLVNQGKLVGIIYLENKLTRGAFNQQRLQVLTLLSSQLAISITNSLLYSQLEKKVAERTRALQQEITERKRAEEKAKSANKAKSYFLSSMSHEFRTPLNVILGYAQILEQDLVLNEEQCNQLTVINRYAHHLLGLVNEVLDLAKIESGLITLDITSFDLNNFLEYLKESFQQQAAQKGLFFTIKKDKDLLRYIKADKRKLQQIFINLLGNAFKFTRSGGISLRVRSAKEAGKPLMLHCEVEDTGIGVLPEKQKKIFAPFVQASTSVDQSVGTGLGLSITRQFVKLMGGTIGLTSTPGIGSTFFFKVAIEQAEHGDIENTVPSRHVVGIASDQKPCRLLIVEDLVANRKILANILSRIGFQVKEAANGIQGVEIWQRWQPDLIWMDIRMPVMNGYEATREIRSKEEEKKVVIIALTAQTFGDEREQALEAGCDDFVSKPYKQEELFAALKKHLDIQFIYQDDDGDTFHSGKQYATTYLEPTCIDALPEDVISRLRIATLELDQQSFFAALQELPSLHEKTATALHVLVENYQFEEVENILGR